MRKIAFMFPGQGSQKVGMGQDFYEEFSTAKSRFDQAKDILDKDLKAIMFNGPDSTLTETENAQPALLLNSYVIYQLLLEKGVSPEMAVGHSLGEYSALVAAESLTLEEALPLVQLRGRLMEEAFPKGQGTMAAVLGLEQEKIEKVIQTLPQDEVVDIANLNCPGQIVISGTRTGIETVTPLLNDAGARRVIPLNVSGPFHSRLMKKANETFAEKVHETTVQQAKIPVYANVTAKPVSEEEEIKKLLIQQMYSPVRFEESIRHMIEAGINTFVEVGNGKVLSGLVRKIDREVKTFSVQDVASFHEFVTWYREESS